MVTKTRDLTMAVRAWNVLIGKRAAQTSVIIQTPVRQGMQEAFERIDIRIGQAQALRQSALSERLLPLEILEGRGGQGLRVCVDVRHMAKLVVVPKAEIEPRYGSLRIQMMLQDVA